MSRQRKPTAKAATAAIFCWMVLVVCMSLPSIGYRPTGAFITPGPLFRGDATRRCWPVRSTSRGPVKEMTARSIRSLLIMMMTPIGDDADTVADTSDEHHPLPVTTAAAAPTSSSSETLGELRQHEHVYRLDPHWYRQYVINILGEDYCNDRWPIPDPVPTPTLARDVQHVWSQQPQGGEEGDQPEQQKQQQLSQLPQSLQKEQEERGDEGGILVPTAMESTKHEVGRSRGKVQPLVGGRPMQRIRTLEEEMKDPSMERPSSVEQESVTPSPDGRVDPSSHSNSWHVNESVEEARSSTLHSEITIRPMGESPKVVGRNYNEGPAARSVDANESVGDVTATAINDRDPSRGNSVPSTDTANNVTTSHEKTNTSSKQDPDNDDDDDDSMPQSFVVYRNIVGGALSYVPLENLTALGYSVQELERLQPDALCVIVTDQVRNPRLGVPMQWLLPDRDAPSEVQIVTSEEEALALVEIDDRTRRDRRQGRREATAAATAASATTTSSPSTTTDSSKQRWKGSSRDDSVDGGARERTTSGVVDPTVARSDDGHDDGNDSRVSRRRRRAEESKMNREPDEFNVRKPRVAGRTYEDEGTVTASGQRSGRNARSTQQAAGASKRGPLDGRGTRIERQIDANLEPSRRSRRGDRNLAMVNGSPKRIYNGREPYRGDSQRAAWEDDLQTEDPPDPNSPIWVNMDTFRRLLRKEAEFRLSVIGDDFEDVIQQESEWRMRLYKWWLWSLHNGVGESIVPPSRYERARRRTSRLPRQSIDDDGRKPARIRPRPPKRQDQDGTPRL